MSVLTERRGRGLDPDYRQMLQTLSEGSVHVHFDPYEDIDWDSPELAVDPQDEGWILDPDLDPLGATSWYRGLPRERQLEVGRFRVANVLRVGAAFESILIRGLMHYAVELPNGSPEFRYCLHEMTEECNHIQMFQELVNRIGVDVPGMRPSFRLLAPVLGFVGGYQPMIFMMGILGGEEPIDHHQKALIRSGRRMPPVVRRTMEIHIAEEARHISFAGEWLRQRVPRLARRQRALVAVLFPVILRWLAGEIMAPPKRECDRLGIPREVYREAFFRSPRSREILASYFGDMRLLAEDTGLMNPAARRVWKWLGITGEPSRFRGEPDRTAQYAA